MLKCGTVSESVTIDHCMWCTYIAKKKQFGINELTKEKKFEIDA